MPKYPVRQARVARQSSTTLDEIEARPEIESEQPQPEQLPVIRPIAGKQVGRVVSNPHTLEHGNIMALQHTVGNRAVQRILRENSTPQKAETTAIQRDLLAAGQWQLTTKGSTFKKRGGKNPIITELDLLIGQYNNPAQLNKRTPLQTIIDKVTLWINNPGNKKNTRRSVLQNLLNDATNAMSSLPSVPVPLAPSSTPPSSTPTTPPTGNPGTWVRATTPSTSQGVTTPLTSPGTTTTPSVTPPTSTTTTPLTMPSTTTPTGGTTTTATTTPPVTTTTLPTTTTVPVTKTFKEQFEEALNATTVDIPALTLKVNGATATNKETVWSDAALMTKAFNKLGSDEYLTLVTRLTMFQAGTTAEDNSTHTEAAEADTIIQDKLSAYVADAASKGRKIEGMVGVVGGEDWDRAGEAHYGQDVWQNGPPPKTPKKDAINGFVDGKGRVWIEKNSGNAGTMIHEGLHKYSDDAFLSTLNFNMNEGTTEVFTRKICASLTTPITRGNYQEQYDVIVLLAAAVTDAVLAAAYFDGKVEELKTAFIDYRKSKGASAKNAATQWNNFKSRMRNGTYDTASTLVS